MKGKPIVGEGIIKMCTFNSSLTNPKNAYFFFDYSYLLVFVWLLCALAQKPTGDYFPPAHQWTQKTPAALGLNPTKIQEAIAFAKAARSKNPRSMEQSHYQSFGKEPYGFAVGPFNDRGDQTGVIVYKGYIIAKWGEPSL
ncbi:MAG: hypothetical protein R2822_10735 [Spirosomataceae bacterium]